MPRPRKQSGLSTINPHPITHQPPHPTNFILIAYPDSSTKLFFAASKYACGSDASEVHTSLHMSLEFQLHCLPTPKEVAEQSPRLARSLALRAYLGKKAEKDFNLEKVVAPVGPISWL